MDTPEARATLKRSHPHVTLREENLAGARLLPNREYMLELLPAGAVAAEVGVAYGDFTREILTRAKPGKLHLVDAWELGRYSPGKAAVETAFKSEIDAGKVEINQGLSTDSLIKFDDDYFDWIYIDTNHGYETTRDELKISAAKVKKSGRIMGHDFVNGNIITPWPYGVIEACHEFCVDAGWRYEFLTMEAHGHFSFSLVKI